MADEQTSKKLLEKQQRRAAEEERRREQQKVARKRNLVTLAIALLIGALVVVLVMQSRDGDDALDAGVGSEQAGCGEIEEHEEEGQDHVEVEPQYGTNPPTSGDHLQTPASAGFFDEPVRPGALVHNMEHGQIIIWYDPDAPPETIDAIEEIVDQEPAATIAVPWDELEGSSDFAMTAWGASQHCRQVSQAVVDDFRKEYQGRGPENVGVPTFEGDAG
jgi:hypothetical protein